MLNVTMNNKGELCYFSLVKPMIKKGFSFKELHSAIKKHIDFQTAKFLTEDCFNDFVETQVVQVITNCCHGMGKLLEGVAFLEVNGVKEPYENFNRDFANEWPLSQVTHLEIDETQMITDTLWYLERDINYAGSHIVYTELAYNGWDIQNAYIKAGYLLKVVGHRMIACKNITESRSYNFYMQKYLSDEDIFDNYSIDMMENYRPEPEDDSVIEVPLNSDEIHYAMKHGYLIADISDGKYICRRYAGMCDHLKNYEQEDQKVAA